VRVDVISPPFFSLLYREASALDISTVPEWTEEDSRRMSERLALLNDTDLRQVLAVLEYMCSPRASWADSPRQEYYSIQRELVRAELQGRGLL
jgi:hypothetical protein